MKKEKTVYRNSVKRGAAKSLPQGGWSDAQAPLVSLRGKPGRGADAPTPSPAAASLADPPGVVAESGTQGNSQKDRPGRLYLIPTPLLAEGANLHQVLPAQVIAIAAQLKHLCAENPKTARAFLAQVARINPLAIPLQAIDIKCFDKNTAFDTGFLQPLRKGEDLGLLSEAGLPAIADPGALLVAAAQDAGFAVTPLTGPSAITLALMASGFNGQAFSFNGYLPIANEERIQAIRHYEKLARSHTQIFIETPYRNIALLEALLSTCAAATQLCIAANLTAADEWICRQTIQRWRTLPLTTMKAKLNRVPTMFLLFCGNTA